LSPFHAQVRPQAASIVIRVAARSRSTVVRASMRRMRHYLMQHNTRNRLFLRRARRIVDRL